MNLFGTHPSTAPCGNPRNDKYNKKSSIRRPPALQRDQRRNPGTTGRGALEEACTRQERSTGTSNDHNTSNTSPDSPGGGRGEHAEQGTEVSKVSLASSRSFLSLHRLRVTRGTDRPSPTYRRRRFSLLNAYEPPTSPHHTHDGVFALRPFLGGLRGVQEFGVSQRKITHNLKA